jgi:hypothetical protein
MSNGYDDSTHFEQLVRMLLRPEVSVRKRSETELEVVTKHCTVVFEFDTDGQLIGMDTLESPA